jgi:hypothetical protein
MPRKRTCRPMETQPASGWRDAAMAMGPKQAKATTALRTPRSAISQGKAEIERQSSLKKQRSQMAIVRLRLKEAGPG